VTAGPAWLLLLEDESGPAEVLTLHLRRAGFAVDVACDDQIALGVLDLSLPRTSG
jgi:DNA-binding response OmpR family regulator